MKKIKSDLKNVLSYIVIISLLCGVIGFVIGLIYEFSKDDFYDHPGEIKYLYSIKNGIKQPATVCLTLEKISNLLKTDKATELSTDDDFIDFDNFRIFKAGTEIKIKKVDYNYPISKIIIKVDKGFLNAYALNSMIHEER